MKEVFSILFGAGFTLALCLALGALLLRALEARFHRVEAALFQFIAGSAVLSFVVTLLCLVHQARRGVFLWGGLSVIAAAVWRSRVAPRRNRPLPALPLDWLVPFLLLFAGF